VSVPLVTDANLGAWLLRCNPDVWDLRQSLEDGLTNIYEWDVVRNYRSRMMAEGQRVIFWVTGNKKGLARGIWGIGHLTSPAHDPVPDDIGEDDVGYWLVEVAPTLDYDSVDLDIPLLPEPIQEVDLRAAGITDLEVQRQPQGQNPSWVSNEQLARLNALLPPWPVAGGHRNEANLSSGGAGFGNSVQNRIVDEAAMKAVQAAYKEDGWTVQDVSADKKGWDLTCTRGPDSYKIEVKGVTGDKPSVLLTANEFRAARNEDNWWLAVVTRAVSKPQLSEYSAEDVLRTAQPYAFQADLSSRT
jgi:hypothetical protein